MIVGIQNEILKIHSLGLLKKLLEDKTTRANIIWATDAYKDRGIKYERDQEIKVDLVTGLNSDVIKNRARKEMEHQAEGVSEIIGEETGAKPELLHSCHNVTRAEFDSGVTYVDLMKGNIETLRDGLD